MPDCDTLPTPPLRPYQYEGVRWLVERFGRHRALLLADDAGLGKTLVALMTAMRLDANRILVVCPAGARRVWRNEIQRWMAWWEPWTILAEPGVRNLELHWHLGANRPVILIVGYDDFSYGTELAQRLDHQIGWDFLILDEAHYTKNASNRTLALYGPRGHQSGVQALANRVLLMTGTPTPNHAGELYQMVRTFWPFAAPGKGTQAEFETAYTRFRDTVYGRQIIGSRNQAQLRRALDDVILRRRKADVLPELPPLVLQDMPLDPYQAGGVDLDEFDMLHAILPDDEDAAVHELGQMASVRRKLGLAKVTGVVAWVQERMASVDKLILFCWHLDVIEQLRQRLLEFGPVVVTGATSPTARQVAVHAFQTRPGTRLFIGQVLAAGTAITLTAASEVAIVEPSWVPGENHQAICRAHRLGQRDSVLASFLYLPDTLDEVIMRTFRRKAREIAELEGV